MTIAVDWDVKSQLMANKHLFKSPEDWEIGGLHQDSWYYGKYGTQFSVT